MRRNLTAAQKATICEDLKQLMIACLLVGFTFGAMIGFAAGRGW